jgi:hypothetical protein
MSKRVKCGELCTFGELKVGDYYNFQYVDIVRRKVSETNSDSLEIVLFDYHCGMSDDTIIIRLSKKDAYKKLREMRPNWTVEYINSLFTKSDTQLELRKAGHFTEDN